MPIVLCDRLTHSNFGGEAVTHELWIAISLAGLAAAIPLVLWFRRKARARSAKRLGRLLAEVPVQLERLQARLSPYVTRGEYLPERKRRPLAAAYDEISTNSLIEIEKLVKRVGDEEARSAVSQGEVHSFFGRQTTTLRPARREPRPPQRRS